MGVAESFKKIEEAARKIRFNKPITNIASGGGEIRSSFKQIILDVEKSEEQASEEDGKR